MAEYESRRTVEIRCPNPRCPAPDKVKRDGRHGAYQRYKCNGCGKKFTAEGKALYKQFPAKQIADAVDSYFSGMSYKQIAENMEQFKDVPEPSKRTIHDWVKGYTNLARRYLAGEIGKDGTPATTPGKRILADTGDHWVADELMLKVGGNDFWCWNVLDTKTRYVLAVHLSKNRDTNDAIAVFEKALANAKKPPTKITTDGLGSYVDAIRAVFPRGTVHVVADGPHGLVNNNISERLQGGIRQRTKTQRGLQVLKTGQDYLDGWIIDYNFFKKHHTLKGRTPAERAGMTNQAPWKSWENVTRLGGEVADWTIKKSRLKRPKRKRAKSKEKTDRDQKEPMPVRKPDISFIEEAVQEYQKQLDQQAMERAKASRKGRRSPAVSAHEHTKRQPGKTKVPKKRAGRGLHEWGQAG